MLNRVVLIGYVGKDPETANVGDGIPVSRFQIATTDRYRNRAGDKTETTEWHSIVAWRKTAEIVADYVVKGALLYIEGKLRTRTWTDDEGRKCWRTEVHADRVLFLGGKRAETDDSEDVPANSE